MDLGSLQGEWEERLLIADRGKRDISFQSKIQMQGR